MAGRIPEGTYTITNLKSQTTARVAHAGSKIFVSSTKENPGPFELWNVKNAKDGGYTIDNVGVNMILMPDSFAAAPNPENGEPVVTHREATIFNIESAGNDTFVIKVQNKDLLWNVEEPVEPRGDVQLRRATGVETERWIFARAQWPPA